ncbi:MAG: hypothetical protein AB7V42_04055 [Thermoleophilia bacterium]
MAAPLAPVEVIERSLRGAPVDAVSVEEFVRGWLDGSAADAQLAAWCMAGGGAAMPRDQVEALAVGLLGSGDRLELGGLGEVGAIHSAGAVGDAAIIVAWPLAAALGVRVATLAPRGVAHTGCPVEALTTIPGFRADLALDGFVRRVRDAGIAVAERPERLAPGERRLRALRDSTGSGPRAGIVAATLLVEVVAGGAPAGVVEIAHGPGGLVADAAEASVVAGHVVALARRWERGVRPVAIGLEEPLGRGAGGAIEVREAAEALRGGGTPQVRELAARLAGELAEAAGVAAAGEGAARAAQALRSGAALEAAERWAEAQEGDPEVWSNPGLLPVAPVRIDVVAPADGWLTRVDARAVGEAARWIGAGRLHPHQSVDPVVGVELLARAGEPVARDQPVAVVHARDEWMGERGRDILATGVEVSPAPPAEGEGDDAGAA